jgi:hypothetical protein
MTRTGVLRSGLVTVVATPDELTATGGWWTAKDTTVGQPAARQREINRALREGMRVGPPAAFRPPARVSLDALYPRPRWMARQVAHYVTAGGQPVLGRDVPLAVVPVPNMTEAQRRAELARLARRLGGAEDDDT